MTVDVNEIEFSAERSGYDLFISHSWKHNSDYDGLIELLDDKTTSPTGIIR